MRWNKGKLKSYSTGNLKTGTRTYQYTYNAKGQRIKKTYSKVKGTETYYQDGIYQRTIEYIYDVNEVIGIYDTSGNILKEDMNMMHMEIVQLEVKQQIKY